MGMNDSEDMSAARAQMSAAVRNFVQVLARERGTTDNPVVTSWAAYASYSSVSLDADDMDGHAVIVPESQDSTTSRGCYGYGIDAFSLKGNI